MREKVCAKNDKVNGLRDDRLEKVGTGPNTYGKCISASSVIRTLCERTEIREFELTMREELFIVSAAVVASLATRSSVV